MSNTKRQLENGIAGKLTRTVVLSMASILIVACTKGDGVQIGTGQDPDPVIVDFPIAYIKSPLPTDDNGVFQQQDLAYVIQGRICHGFHQSGFNTVPGFLVEIRPGDIGWRRRSKGQSQATGAMDGTGPITPHNFIADTIDR